MILREGECRKGSEFVRGTSYLFGVLRLAVGFTGEVIPFKNSAAISGEADPMLGQ